MRPVIRKQKYQFTEEEHYWFGGNSLLTHLVNSLHVIVPEGEKFFIRSVNMHLEKYPVVDAELAADIKAFIGQEVQHYKQHHKTWESLEKAYGSGLTTFSILYQKTAFGALERIARKVFGPKHFLSITAALEHFTAIISEQTFRNPQILDGLSDDMKDLLLWHAYEELEHKSVCYDLLQATESSYFLRASGMAVATAGFWGYLFLGFTIFLLTDKKFSLFKNLKAIPGYLRIFKGTLGPLVRDYLRYYKPDFHPNELEWPSAAKDYLEQMKAEVVPISAS